MSSSTTLKDFAVRDDRIEIAVKGVVLASLVATFYRVPVLGPVAAVAARILRLPAHWQDRSALEAAAFATGTWMKR